MSFSTISSDLSPGWMLLRIVLKLRWPIAAASRPQAAIGSGDRRRTAYRRRIGWAARRRPLRALAGQRKFAAGRA